MQISSYERVKTIAPSIEPLTDHPLISNLINEKFVFAYLHTYNT